METINKNFWKEKGIDYANLYQNQLLGNLKLDNLIKINDYEIKDIINLTDKVFGKGFITESKLQKSLITQNGYIINLLSIKYNYQTISYALFYPGGERKEDIQISSNKDLREYFYLQTIITDTNFQKLQLGEILLTEILERIKRIGNKGLFLHAWVESEDNSSQNFFRKFGANEICRYEKPWYEDSLKNGRNCIKCGNPCSCDSVEMLIEI